MSEDFLPVMERTSTPVTRPLEAIGWLLFTLLLICSPALVWAVWTWAL